MLEDVPGVLRVPSQLGPNVTAPVIEVCIEVDLFVDGHLEDPPPQRGRLFAHSGNRGRPFSAKRFSVSNNSFGSIGLVK
jgi:hypothetical protein